jgi:hypothetical protein
MWSPPGDAGIGIEKKGYVPVGKYKRRTGQDSRL